MCYPLRGATEQRSQGLNPGLPCSTGHLPLTSATSLELWRITVSRVGVAWGPPGQGDKVAPGIPATSLFWQASDSKSADEETVGTPRGLKAVPVLVPQCPPG